MTLRISHERKLIYWHTPKCAGTSITREGGFQGYQPAYRDKYRQRVCDSPLSFFNSVTRREQGVERLGYREFSTVRNPYTRFVSAYNHCQYNRRFLANMGYRGVGFHDFQRLVVGGKGEQKPQKIGPWFWAYFHILIPQTYFLCNPDKQPFCEVVKFESLPDGVEKFGLKMSERIKVSKPPKNVQTTLLPQTVEFIGNWFADDFEIFGYDLEPPKKVLA